MGDSEISLPNRYTELINAVRLSAVGEDVGRIRSNPKVRQISVEEPRALLLDNSVPYVRANGPDSARSRGFRGTGTALADGSASGQVVAVLDTGIDHTNPMFDSRFTDEEFEQRSADIRPVRIAGLPYTPGVNHPKVIYRALFSTAHVEGDDNGHGTHSSSTAAGLKARTDTGEVVEGVAPGAALMDYKICPSLFCSEELILASLEDAVKERDPAGFPKPKATVVNMSFGDCTGNPEAADAVAAGNLQRRQGSAPTARTTTSRW